MPQARNGDPDRRMKEMLFELLGMIDRGELNMVGRTYGGVIVKDGDGYKQAYLRLSFEDHPLVEES